MKIPLLILLLTFPLAAVEPPRDEAIVILDEAGVRNLSIETVPAGETDFETTLFVLGEIDHTCESHAVLSSRIAGRIIEVGIHEGEFATKGEVLARIESRQPGEPPPVIELRSPADGLVVRSKVHLGAPVEPDMELLVIHDLATVWAVAKVPQHQAAILTDGLTAKVRVPALGPEERLASYLRLDVGADAATGTIDAIFELPNPGNQLRPGMRAELSLIASQRGNILSIPRDALQGDRSNRFVFIRDYELENAFVRVPVTVGEMNPDRVGIVAGLFPGDEVVTRGSYALSFAGKGSVSLKEALDAAHGHAHNEDGSEITTTGTHDHSHGHSHDHASTNPIVIFLAIACGVLFILLLASSIRNWKAQPSPKS